MSTIQQRLENAEECVRLSGDAHELGQCRAARKALQAGDLERVQRILKALEAPVAQNYNHVDTTGDERFVRPLQKMFDPCCQ